MSNKRFEMHEIGQVLVQMRLGATDRAIAQSGLMERKAGPAPEAGGRTGASGQQDHDHVKVAPRKASESKKGEQKPESGGKKRRQREK